MEKVKKYLNIALIAALLAACWAEFILCFARGYEELWYTILVPSVIVTVLAAFALKTRFKWLYFIGTAVVLVGAVLLIGSIAVTSMLTSRIFRRAFQDFGSSYNYPSTQDDWEDYLDGLLQ